MALDLTILAALGAVAFFALAWLLPILRSFIKAAVLAAVLALLGVVIAGQLFSDRILELPWGWF